MSEPMSPSAGIFGRFRRRVREYRRTRPFWGALWTMFGGFLIAWFAYGPVNILIHAGLGGLAGLLIGTTIFAMGVFMMVTPDQRHLVSVLATILAVASFPLSNFGGFVLGMTFSLLGACMSFGWMPEKPVSKHRLRALLRRPQPIS